MRAEILSAGIPVEERREDPAGQRGRDEQRISLKSLDYEVADLDGRRIILSQLHVVFRPPRLMSGRGRTVDPFGSLHPPPACGHLLGGKDVWYANKHLTLKLPHRPKEAGHRSLKTKSRTQQHYPSGSRQNVPAADAVDVV